MSYEQSNVGLGMVPHRRGCRCDECEVDRLRARLAEVTKIDSLALCNALDKVHSLEARLAEYEADASELRALLAKSVQAEADARERLADLEAERATMISVVATARERAENAEKWRDYYRAKWLGETAVPQPDPPDTAPREGE